MLEVEALEAGYGERAVLKGLSFSIEEGEVVAVLAPTEPGRRRS
jgi:ABC-type branched-subunit amino acid transport system ATPase component